MSRKRGGSVIEKFIHRVTKREAVIRLEKHSMMFHTTIEGSDGVEEIFESRDGDAVRTWLEKKLVHTTDAMKMSWQPVIEINAREDRYWRSRGGEENKQELQIEIDRYFLGLTPNEEEWRKIEWKEGDPNSPMKLDERMMYAKSERYGDGPKAKSERNWSHAKPLSIPHYENGKSVVPFTDELWAGLAHILLTIKQIRKEIDRLTSTNKGMAQLTEIGAGKVTLMLGTGDKR